MRCVILAAGDGSRLAPLTWQHPKPLLCVLGRPLLDYTMDALVAAGVCDLVLVVGYRGDIRHIGKGLGCWNAVDTGVFLFTPHIFDAIDALHAAGDLNPILGQSVTWLTEQGYGLRACDVPGAWWTDIDTLDDLQNQVTVISFLVALSAAVAFATGASVWGGVLAQTSSILDGVDGDLARRQGAATRFGAFFDAVLDRYADGGAIVLGMIVSVQEPGLFSST